MGMMELLLGLGAGLIASLIVAELYAWAPRLSSALLESAVRLLPRREQARMREEWSAHLEAIPAGVSKIIAAVGFLWSGFVIARETSESATAKPVNESSPASEAEKEVAALSARNGVHEKGHQLSRREIQCLQWAALGKTDDEISDILGLSRFTISSYIKSARYKLGCINRVSAVAEAIARKLIHP